MAELGSGCRGVGELVMEGLGWGAVAAISRPLLANKLPQAANHNSNHLNKLQRTSQAARKVGLARH